ncbi:hypothetical protein SAMN05421813_103182 [Daejeonella rubra]|uniref:Uncharacterized protein n=1 Tax=Daejeonella rubra TaxID=990371 RepID=A0A1G9NUM8_9SPHI|nr:hypothetical protein [Daejeonella rubra]SDL90013.1 hypothetical protein SAMN05421813_103182 [Daejeonella rubra]
MTQIKLLKAALAIGNCLFILILIIFSIDRAISSDKFPVDLALIVLLSIALVLLIIYGLRAYQNWNDKGSYLAILAISTLFDLIYLFIIYGFVVNPKLFLKIPHWIVFSIIMLLLWVLNVIALLKRDKL